MKTKTIVKHENMKYYYWLCHAYYLYQFQHTINEFYASAAVLVYQDGQRRVPFVSKKKTDNN